MPTKKSASLILRVEGYKHTLKEDLPYGSWRMSCDEIHLNPATVLALLIHGTLFQVTLKIKIVVKKLIN
jgi:hypothetical protein